MSVQNEAQWLQTLFSPLFLYFNRSAILLNVSGEPSFYGLPELTIRKSKLVDFLPELIGIDTRQKAVIPLITLSNNATVNFHINPHRNGFELLMLDASEDGKTLQSAQQTSNEAQLSHAKSKQLQQEIKILNNELIQASRAKSLFISGMSHEFRTPIMGMLGNVAWVEKQLSDDTNAMQKLNAIETNATYLLGLVDNLLQHGKISTEQLKISRVSVYPKRIFHSVLETMLPLAEKRNIVLAHEIKLPRELNLLLDEYHLRRVLYNLIGNAIKFTDFGSVLITAEHNESGLAISIEDSGVGIPAEDLEKILLPFTRAGNVAHRRGIGLGLSYANEIIQAMGGALNLNSQIDSGTTASFTLPATRAIRSTSSSMRFNEPASTGQVLLIEDSAEVVSLYNYYFHDMGIDLVTVSNSADLYRHMAKSSPEILLVDRVLGEENGIELVSDIRAKGYEGFIILLTASIDVDQMLENEAIDAGCDEFIQKPADVARLADTVRLRLQRIRNKSDSHIKNALVENYIKTFADKINNLKTTLLGLQKSPDAPQSLKDLKIQVHKISGSAGSYGYPDISGVSIELERTIDQYEKTSENQSLHGIEAGCLRLTKELEQYI